MNLTGKLLLLFLLTLTHLKAQITVSAWIDRKTVPINESFTLTISVMGENIGNINLDIPTFSDFNIYQSGKSSNISIVNGRVTTTIEFYYTLIPKRTGRFIIPKIGVFTGKEKYFTKEIEVEVTSPSIQTQTPQKSYPKQQTQTNRRAFQRDINRDDLIFVKATVDKKTAYVGEQITLTIGFYTALPISANPQYYAPTYSNLLSEDLPPIRTGTEIIDGIRYYFAQTKTALFGIIPGKAKISPAKIIASVQQDTILDPFDPNFIQKFFSQFSQTRDITLQTKPIEIEILELPPPPKDFSQAVGNFFITAKVDNTTLHAGDALNIIVEITGKGNVKTINPPKIENPALKIYDILSSETISKNNDIVGGTKRFTYIATPLQEGNIIIEPIKFTFFNIDTKRYETISTPPLKITALKPKEGKSIDFDSTKPKTDIIAKAEDINYIYEKIPSSALYRFTNKISRINFTIDLLILLTLSVVAFIRSKMLKNADLPYYRYEKALSNFEKRIKEGLKNDDKSKILSILYDAVYEYFSWKLNENVSHLAFLKLKSILKEKKPTISDELLKELQELLERIELLNFTKTHSSDTEISSIIEKTITTIKKIDKEFKK